MTWRLKVQGVVLVVMILALVALAAGASWVDGDAFDGFGLF
jgi:hypothetical protein